MARNPCLLYTFLEINVYLFHKIMKRSRAKVSVDIVCNICNIPVICLILITYELLGSNSYFIAYSNYQIDPLGTHAYTVAGQHSTGPGCPTTNDLRSIRDHFVICALHLDPQSKNILAKPECDCNMIESPGSPALPPPIDAHRIEEAQMRRFKFLLFAALLVGFAALAYARKYSRDRVNEYANPETSWTA